MSSAEYACPVWSRSAHVKKLDTTLNNTYRKITGCLKPTKVEEIYHLAGIGSPNQRRTNTCLKERMKQATDDRHMLHGYLQPHKRLISRHSFLDSVPPPEQNPPPSAKPVLIKGLGWWWRILFRWWDRILHHQPSPYSSKGLTWSGRSGNA